MEPERYADLSTEECLRRRKLMRELLGGDQVATRIINACAREGITTPDQLRAAREVDLADMQNMGAVCMRRLEEVLGWDE